MDVASEEKGESLAEHAWSEIARVGAAFGDPNRLKILHLLGQSRRSGEELATMLGLSAPNVSAHLRTLLEAGMVSRTREGRRVYYALRCPSVATLLLTLRDAGMELSAELRESMRDFDVDAPLDSLSSPELEARVRDGSLWVVDVRPVEEYAAGHLPLARHVEMTALAEFCRELPSGSEVLVYCRGPFCEGAAEAVRRLRALGVSASRWRGGVMDWSSAGHVLSASEVSL